MDGLPPTMAPGWGVFERRFLGFARSRALRGEDLAPHARRLGGELLEGSGVPHHVLGARPLAREVPLVAFAAPHLARLPAALAPRAPLAVAFLAFEEHDPVAALREPPFEEERHVEDDDRRPPRRLRLRA